MKNIAELLRVHTQLHNAYDKNDDSMDNAFIAWENTTIIRAFNQLRIDDTNDSRANNATELVWHFYDGGENTYANYSERLDDAVSALIVWWCATRNV